MPPPSLERHIMKKMLESRPFLLGVGILALAQASVASNINHAKAQFMQAMNDASILKKQADKKRQLQKKIIENAVPVDSSKPSFLRRKLEDANYYVAEDYGDFGFDIASYSLKYAGCSAISTYSDAMAKENDGVDSVFDTMSYVVFRLCPTETCSGSSTYGCAYDYGEYMLPMDYWLEIMSDYREEEFERYCDFCANCMANDRRRLDEEGAVEGYYEAGEAEEEQHGCAYYNACSTYADVCNQRRLDGAVDVSDYFECTKIRHNGDVYYVGPHCSSDKSKIVIGLFYDEYCTQYFSSSKLYKYSGIMISPEMMEPFYKSDCIACKESDLPYQEIDEDAQDDDEITEMCENLYSASAKCNRHIGGATSKSYESSEQDDNSNVACNFINSVVTGRYDEQGFIYVNTKRYRQDNNKNLYANSESYQVVTAGQIVGLLLLSCLFTGLSVRSCFLRQAVAKKAAWKPSKADPNASIASQMSRQNSGIGNARSWVQID